MSTDTRDEMPDTLIEGNFYSVLKEWGLPTARYANGQYKSDDSQACWEAYLCGQRGTSCQQLPEHLCTDTGARDGSSE